MNEEKSQRSDSTCSSSSTSDWGAGDCEGATDALRVGVKGAGDFASCGLPFNTPPFPIVAAGEGDLALGVSSVWAREEEGGTERRDMLR